MKDRVAIVGVGIHPFGRTPGKSGLQQGAFAARQALREASTPAEFLERLRRDD